MSVVTGSLEQALDGMLELRPFPAAASQLMAACNDESSTVRELSEIIKYDPGLSTRLLSIANSPMYGFSAQIRSIDHATVVLGMRALRDLAVSTAVGDVFGSGTRATDGIRQKLWDHSLACGCIARLLAEQAKDVAPDEAFLGGVIHDIGKLFILDYDTEAYLQLLADRNRQDLTAAETDRYGMPHTAVGQICGQNWGFPDEVVDVIECHHEPAAAVFNGPLVDIVFAANRLAARWFEEVESEDTDTEILTQARIEVDPEKLADINRTAIHVDPDPRMPDHDDGVDRRSDKLHGGRSTQWLLFEQENDSHDH